MRQKTNYLGTVFTVLMFLCSMFAGFISVETVAAANGLGEVTQFSTEEGYEVTPPAQAVITVDESKDITLWIHNDDEQYGHCIDEIVVTFPDTWQGAIDTATSTVTNLGTVVLTNEADDGTYSGLVNDSLSLRIVPDFSVNGVPLCYSGTSKIVLKGLQAPADEENSTIMIMTSDEDHNEGSSSYVREPIDVLPSIKVTNTDELRFRYIIFNPDLSTDGGDVELDAAGANARYRITAEAKGAWARLDELKVRSDSATGADVYIDKNGNRRLDPGTDYLVGSMALASSGINEILLDSTDADIANQMYDGFVRDAEQGGNFVTYFIDTTATLKFRGLEDTPADSSIDPTRGGTGLEGTTEGTVLSVEDTSRERYVMVQIVRQNAAGVWVDVRDDSVPLHYTTNLGIFDQFSAKMGVRYTDDNGMAEVMLLPETTAGVADVQVCYPDEYCDIVNVGINAGAADSFTVTPDSSVEAGSEVLIAATIFDQYGNQISNKDNQGSNPAYNDNRPLVELDVVDAPDTDALLDDDDSADGWDTHEEENANMGIGDALLRTSATIGDNVVEVCVEDIGCENVTITGILGQADYIDCEIIGLEASEIDADDCFTVEVRVKDANGNPLTKWESLVEISLDTETLDAAGNGATKYISSTDLREESFYSGNQMVKGKLNNGDPAMATVEICGCEGLGTFDLVCKSDTLTEDSETLDVVNSEATCIDVEALDIGACSYVGQLQTSIVDTCMNPLIDQECMGSTPTSCVALNTSCGVLSTAKTCVDLYNTGYAPLVDIDMSDCSCGDITITAIDEPDCCEGVYSDPLPMCSDVTINKLGPATHIDMYVNPDKSNQDDFWVSELAQVDLELRDECGQLYICEETNNVDVELTGEDCAIDEIQVDSPFDTGVEMCSFEDVAVHKVVIENCAEADKTSGAKEWTDLPEEVDLVIDKIAFEYNGPMTSGVTACIYEETEETTGFQAGEDLNWGCIDLGAVPDVPADGDADPNHGAYDELHSVGARDGVSDIYYIELDSRVSRSLLNEYDNQRMGGAIVEPSDTKDFYIVLSAPNADCGVYDADYLFYQDYSSPDLVEWDSGAHVRDTIAGSESYTIRNDDYTSDDAYPDTSASTPYYGFGDRILHNLEFAGDGLASFWFRDLVSEIVEIHIDAGLPVYFMGNAPAMANDQAKVEFLVQPATQVVARNHGDLENPSSNICDDESTDCEAAMACSEEGYDFNLQVTDGFQNQVGLSTEVQLHSCMTYPKTVEFEDMPEFDVWGAIGIDHQSPFYVGEMSDPWDVCFDQEEFEDALKDHIAEYSDGDYFAEGYIASEKFQEFLDDMFAEKSVRFLDENGDEITETDSAGNLIVHTDSDGKAEVRVVSDDASLFAQRGVESSFRVFFVPHALDADYMDIEFVPGAPASWDVVAWPDNGIPADGEQEARIFIRKLDACGNPVEVDEPVKVTATSDSGRAVISRDFSGNNNYDNTVEGYISDCDDSMWPWFEDCSLTVLNDVIEDVTITVEDQSCSGTSGYCVGPSGSGCNLDNYGQQGSQTACEAWDVECLWVTDCQEPAETTISFVGAPVQLTITEIKHSDLIPADGWIKGPGFEMPTDSCTEHPQGQLCSYEPEKCFSQCVNYGNSGGWVTVEIQDKYGSRVTTYLGDGFAEDPGDVEGNPDYTAEKICVGLDDPRAFIQDYTYGFTDLDLVAGPHPTLGRVYCGDLTQGYGKFKISYLMRDKDGELLDSRETETVAVSVFDVCDRDKFETYGASWPESQYDDLCNAQEYDENNLPDSETASRLDADAAKMIFTALPDRWDIEADKYTVSADGEDYAELVINIENEYMDVRSSVSATVQSSLLGSIVESEAITPECYVEGIYDVLNPTSINVMTEDCSGGKAKLRISSTEAGVATVTVSGNYFGCTEWDYGDAEDSEVYAVPECEAWGVIPMTPKTIKIEFKQSFQNKIVLNEGWNFFSVPRTLDPVNDQWLELGLNAICDADAYWDDAVQGWVSPVPDTTVVEPLEGYWCKVSEATEVSVVPYETAGLPFLPPIKTIFAGWNDVGLSASTETVMEHALISIDSIYTLVLDWSEGLQRYLGFANTGEAGGGDVSGTTGTEDMNAGEAYFIRASQSGDLVGLS